MYTFYWYPKCSTCKKAKAWLDQHGVSYQTVDMIKEVPKASTIETWLETSQSTNPSPVQHKRDEISGTWTERSSRRVYGFKSEPSLIDRWYADQATTDLTRGPACCNWIQ